MKYQFKAYNLKIEISYNASPAKGGHLKIIKALPADLPKVLALIEDVKKDMNARGNEQWNDEYPRSDIFQKDLDEGTLFAMKDGQNVIGIIVISEHQDKQYEDIPWQDKGGKYLVGHRIAVQPGHHRKGVATRLMDYFEDHARKNGFTSIRLDTYHKNDRSQAMLESRGYKKLPGKINFPECQGPYYCYEMLLE